MTKAGSALIFECESDGEYLSINHIAHELGSKVTANGEEEEEEDDTPDYTGPVFEDLDDTLQQVGGRPMRGQGPGLVSSCCVGRGYEVPSEVWDVFFPASWREDQAHYIAHFSLALMPGVP